jgi:hypothetical protein
LKALGLVPLNGHTMQSTTDNATVRNSVGAMA